MNKAAIHLASTALFLAMSGAAWSQSSGSSGQTPPSSPPTGNQDSAPPQTQQINGQNKQSGNDLNSSKKNEGSAGDSDPNSTQRIKKQGTGAGNNLSANEKSAQAGTDFDKLDAAHSGTLTPDQAKSNKWLSKHFKKCDSDNDGAVSRDEYTACRASHGKGSS